MKTCAVIGAGLRGQYAYPPYVKENGGLKFVAVADLIPGRVESFKKEYHIPDKMCFESGEELLKQGKLADAVIIATMDQDHYAQTIEAIKLGYDILLEKPISPNLKECLEIEKLAKEYNTKIIVCHVLRYTPFYKKIKELLDEKTIGQIINVEAMENVGHWHQAHSFVRGNWRKEETSSPMILQKCCHDLDIYTWLIGSEAESLSSYGDLAYFKKENAPKDAPICCLDHCPNRDNCRYDVYKTYLTEHIGWPTNAIGTDMSLDGRVKSLKETMYGHCVFHCDNDVVDHQTINIKYKNGVIMTFTMTAFTEECDRTLRIMGTHGEIKAAMNSGVIEITEFLGGNKTIVTIEKQDKGHGGGDYGIMHNFIGILNEEMTNSNPISGSVHSHVLAFASEKSRKSGETINIKEYIGK
ncbi:Gfo/Idh/MocA family protein [Anaerorhabdus furcosa]|uniref:Oxidoreductase family, C-terminal alpha/beta domain n=1 Tax=Anaerorhabdus furcosa TaxID=118967 RepID=A0A1T4KLW2_9FIRM|nr:Gfo/Idh/MocA family oxidoreductase [Anaerorhabdus furcosa]SJZ43380.1 Oxidoreductase family, C-terminal alpha/beta domain [Anaerorhabdus furcosa]